MSLIVTAPTFTENKIAQVHTGSLAPKPRRDFDPRPILLLAFNTHYTAQPAFHLNKCSKASHQERAVGTINVVQAPAGCVSRLDKTGPSLQL